MRKVSPCWRTLRLCWWGMLQRCENGNYAWYRLYGGRGIKVCKRWHKFELFFADMSPTWCAGLTLERSDNDGNYSPNNCRWATRKEQANNRRPPHRALGPQRDSRFITFDGKTLHLFAWARSAGLKPETLSARLRRGWSVQDALNTPAGRR